MTSDFIYYDDIVKDVERFVRHTAMRYHVRQVDVTDIIKEVVV